MATTLRIEHLVKRFEGDAPENMVEESEANLLQEFFTQLQQAGISFDTYLMQQDHNAEPHQLCHSAYVRPDLVPRYAVDRQADL